MKNLFIVLFLIFKDFPDFERISSLNRYICRLRASLLSLMPNKKVGKNVLIYKGFHFSLKMNMQIGDYTKIYPNVSVTGKNFSIGNHSAIFSDTEIDATSDVNIGSRVCIGHRVEIYSHVHHYEKKDTPIFRSPESDMPSSIEDDVLLYNNVKIMPGVSVKRGSIIGNSAVVFNNTVENGIYTGMPARLVSTRS